MGLYGSALLFGQDISSVPAVVSLGQNIKLPAGLWQKSVKERFMHDPRAANFCGDFLLSGESLLDEAGGGGLVRAGPLVKAEVMNSSGVCKRFRCFFKK